MTWLTTLLPILLTFLQWIITEWGNTPAPAVAKAAGSDPVGDKLKAALANLQDAHAEATRMAAKP